MNKINIMRKLKENIIMQQEVNNEHLSLIKTMIQETDRTIDILDARVDNLETQVELIKKGVTKYEKSSK